MFEIGIVVRDEFRGNFITAKADDDDVNVRFAASLALPSERAVSKVNLHAETTEEQSPDDWYLSPCVMELVATKPTRICVP